MKTYYRILAFIVCICICVSSCASHPPTFSTTAEDISSTTESTSVTETTTVATSKKPYEKFTGPYAEILNAYAEFEWNDYKVIDDNLLGDSLFANGYGNSCNFGDSPMLAYAYYDVNKDGSMELIIGAIPYSSAEPCLSGIYIIKNGKPVSVIQVKDRFNLRLLLQEDGRIVIEHSNGSRDWGEDSFCELDNNGKLKTLEKLYTNGLNRTNYDEETGEGLYYNRAKEVKGKQVTITEDEYVFILQKYGTWGYGTGIPESEIREIELEWKLLVNK